MPRQLEGIRLPDGIGPPKRCNPELLRLLQLRHELSQEALCLYKPLPAAIPAHASRANWRIFEGTVRSSKTTAAIIELVRAVTGTDPHHKYPTKNGRALVVGLDLDHVRDPLWSKIAKPGAFSVIKDPETGLMRAVRPDPNNPDTLDPYDVEHRSEWQPAPPLLPPRLIRDVAMEDTKRGIPRIVTMHNGWEILFRSCRGAPPRGNAYDLVLFDEEIDNEDFYPEACRGMTIPSLSSGGGPGHGIGIWSCTPQSATMQLLELRDLANVKGSGVEAFFFNLEHNPYMLPAARKAFYESLSEEQREVMYHGQYAVVGRRIYPEYSPMGPHGCEPFPIPEDYARFLVVDPGTQRCATLFAAVDPAEKHVYVYDGFLQRATDAERWADEVERLHKPSGLKFEEVIFDQRMGRETHVGLKTTVAEVWFAALAKRGLAPRTRGILNGFTPGSADTALREQCLRDWMRIRGDPGVKGTARLQKFRGILAALDKQISHVHTKKDNPDKRIRMEDDYLDCIEYLAAADPRYTPPAPLSKSEAQSEEEEEAERIWLLFQKKKKRNQSEPGITLH